MQTLGKIAATVGVIAVIAVGSVAPAAAYYYHRYAITPTTIITTTIVITSAQFLRTPTSNGMFLASATSLLIAASRRLGQSIYLLTGITALALTQ